MAHEEESLTDEELRQFLLGKVDDEERQRIESLFLTDPTAREKVLAAEQDLIDDYVENCLTTADRDVFLERYGDTPTQQRKLRIAKSIKEWAVASAAVSENTFVPAPNRLRSGWRLRPVYLIPIAATVLIAITVVALWLSIRISRNREHAAIEQELTRFNASFDPHQFGERQMMALAPISVRGGEPGNELTKGADVGVVELRLLWIQKERYPSYRVVIGRVGDDKRFTIRDLRPESDGAILVRLPVRVLTRGVYQIELTADGATGATEEYQLRVRG